ncbi:hypothetical protein G4D82_07830 [Flavobacterium sp. CYK-4]|uniref:DUF6095 family protein n=1 Tax=Flavobacterium lotistagni TaxID=2709660 RepID=UPI001408D09D|nr:DUF6095 family protein [Flavobacterium lotistagni]NHM07127.1 hypothetical protein [Flavobacterium lotistagni]
MAVDKEVLNKAIRNLAWALPLMFIGPSVIYNAFINKQNVWHYLVLAIGIVISLGAVFLLFKGVQLIVKSLFDGNDD